MLFDALIYNYILDTRWFYGPNPTWGEEWTIHIVGLFVVGFVWFFLLSIAYYVAEQLSYKYFPKYAKMNTIEKTDWTSRIVASFVIIIGIYFAFLLKWEGEEHHIYTTAPVTNYHDSEWLFYKEVSKKQMFLLYHIYALLLGYEIYDLKNCINLKMTSGVIHHAVLIVMFPIGWSATILGIPAVYMVQLSYCSNIPAHIRSFLGHTGHRDTALYRYNRWAWWTAYVVFRLFGIPWFSAQMWFVMPALKAQTAMFTIVWYFSSMAVHYALSMYWFVNMSRTMFPPKDYDLKKVESFDQLPKIPADPKGGQKFD